ncbi:MULTISPECIES: DNA polymerase III subunit gamma and tau [Cryobacterium]|uniref:DNA-directed DNA polymerase n=1 Tax=Cryobacterium breve TaxID=1259258 RepID=A0ABY2IZF3_9MICO|nr:MULTISPECIES: DNA polymerase III subunit gamma and tau [Cryobacterium]TFC92936.1 DNA polymerase III subunit gamma and tau [Cryobacterium sp. TmT3-12]TFC97889.1 DNA polymerase III subunit gamma and tau [Cryobacterium breve]
MVTALYRRYRPETFAEMIGQSQVTEPLMTALRTNRVNHAYLFSGPRGCGKTTSARILARCLNCAEGPTDTPCGVCPSCVELSRDGGGSLDVVEIDAASHNGVDDARDIRERAIFAPARDRYKIFILDEAHMVTPQGFNALLKIVEEPPEHVKFIFATTEPEKVIGTIRSRTHHYPFRLVPPGQMLEYVQQMCDTEQMTVAPGVLPLVVRAGGGSPRDTLSLLDQLMAGSDGHSVEYERAVALLGYTNATLLDESIDAIADRDPSAAFDAVDRVVQTGQDPRRFVEDLLERLRDLIIVGATSAAGAAAVLRGVPQDELDRMASQAAKFGPAELSRTADVINAALTEMTGATSPRLHLELMIARVLIPASDDSARGALARVERLERRIGVGTGAGVGSGAGSDSGSGDIPATDAPDTSPVGSPPRGAAVAATEPARPPATAGQAATLGGAPSVGAGADAGDATPAAAARAIGPVTLQQVKDAWPQVLESVKAAKISAWLVLYTARAMELRGGELLVLSFPSHNDVAGLKQSAAPGQGVGDYLKRAVNEVLGFTPKLTAIVDSSQRTDAPASPISAVSAPTSPAPSSTASAPPSGSGAPTSAAPPEATSPAAASATAPTAAVNSPAATGSATGFATGSATGSSGTRTKPKAAAAATEEASAVDADPDPAAAPVTGWATVAIPSSSDSGSGWATVAIPGAAQAGSAATPNLASAGSAAAVVSAATASQAAAQTSQQTSAQTSAQTSQHTSPQTASRSTPTATAPTSATEPASVPGVESEPPYDDEPPPYDEEFPPDLHAGGAQSGRVQPSAARATAPSPSSGNGNGNGSGNQTADQTATQPRTQGHASNPAVGAASVARRGPAFAEKQRYGESVVREILGATFLEEQPHDPAPRTRGD